MSLKRKIGKLGEFKSLSFYHTRKHHLNVNMFLKFTLTVTFGGKLLQNEGRKRI